MKKLFTATTALVFVVLICGVAFLGCEGEEGPVGPGADSSGSCGSCHNVTTSVLAKQVQYQNSVHYTGGHGGYGTRNSCSECHSHEGFEAYVTTGETGLVFEDSTPPNCRTCHNIHENYDETDYSMSTMTAVITSPMLADIPEATNFGKGNVCANCHRARERELELVVGGVDVVVDHLDPHHGPQANILAGFGAFEIEGSLPYINSSHTTAVTDGCVTCHMGDNSRNTSGGHTFIVNETGCAAAACHSDIEDIEDYRGAQDEISELLEELAVLLVADSLVVLDEDDPEDFLESDSIEDQTVSSAKAGAILNFYFVVEDKSLGIHNFKYSKALLQNSIEVFE
ncbi:hypothetical protein ACFL50_02100 [Candidatus Latescibacterota bacterium]